jgi:hypothetical protein
MELYTVQLRFNVHLLWYKNIETFNIVPRSREGCIPGSECQLCLDCEQNHFQPVSAEKPDGLHPPSPGSNFPHVPNLSARK